MDLVNKNVKFHSYKEMLLHGSVVQNSITTRNVYKGRSEVEFETVLMTWRLKKCIT